MKRNPVVMMVAASFLAVAMHFCAAGGWSGAGAAALVSGGDPILTDPCEGYPDDVYCPDASGETCTFHLEVFQDSMVNKTRTKQPSQQVCKNTKGCLAMDYFPPKLGCK